MASRKRPLSPHLMVYKPQITSILSITHRATGVALAFGALLLANWVISGIYGPDAFAMAQNLLGSIVGKIILFGLTLSLFFHLGNGIRHLAWDIGKGYELTHLRTSGMVVIIFTIVMSIATWFAAYSVAGGN